MSSSKTFKRNLSLGSWFFFYKKGSIPTPKCWNFIEEALQKHDVDQDEIRYHLVMLAWETTHFLGDKEEDLDVGVSSLREIVEAPQHEK